MNELSGCVLFSSMSNEKLELEVYKRHSWGLTPERKRDILLIDDECMSRENNSSLLDSIERAKWEGDRAFELAAELKEIFSNSGARAASDWVSERMDLVAPRIHYSLVLTLRNLKERKSVLERRKKERGYRSRVQVRQFEKHHPNSLQSLDASSSWTVLIDETGSNFDDRDLDLTKPYTVGKIVALAIPDYSHLPPMGRFHAADTTHEAVDGVVQKILDASVGVFGFSVEDNSSRNSYWIGHVHHVVRWLLLQLPLDSSEPISKVRVLVEQRDAFDINTNMDLMAASIESELKSVDAAKFSGLSLSIEIMGKDHELNGYVDALAFTWGSNSSASGDRLRKSKLLGSCFVKANSRAMQHLYLALCRNANLAPSDWYELCAASSDDPEDFLSKKLDELADRAKVDQELWNSYLDEVRRRLHHKDYQLRDLARSTSWLERIPGVQSDIPGALLLQLASSRLAASNHLGRRDFTAVSRCLDLVDKLEDEAPDLCCEALLRIASATTNSFEFGILEPKLLEWIDKPIAIPTLVNHAKLLSTRAQLLAFQGHERAAIPIFNRAIEALQRLSDPKIAKREIEQTNTYRLISLMDCTTSNSEDLESELVAHLNFDSLETAARRLATSKQADRFKHHLLLRYLVKNLKQSRSACEQYVSNRAKWSTGSGHPWQLIEFYRAWILKELGDLEGSRLQLEAAIESCRQDDTGTVLMWMADVFAIAGNALGISGKPSTPVQIDGFAAPYDKATEFYEKAAAVRTGMSNEEVLLHIRTCLPFNFH